MHEKTSDSLFFGLGSALTRDDIMYFWNCVKTDKPVINIKSVLIWAYPHITLYFAS